MKLLRCCFRGCLVLVLASPGLPAAEQGAPAAAELRYRNDFQDTPVGAPPRELLILEGAFTVQEEGGQKYLELPGAPLETFALLFGPAFDPKTDQGVTVSARFYGVRKGRRYPAFGIGVCGAGGYRLVASPAKGAMELYDGDAVVASEPYDWKSETWTRLRLELRKSGDRWQLQGKAWGAGQPEPGTWLVSSPPRQDPYSGRASLWGIPYSGQPIRFDDLLVQPSPGGEAD